MSGLSPKEVVSAFPCSGPFSTSCWRVIAHRDAWLSDTRMKMGNLYYRGCLQKQTQDMLKQILKQENTLCRKTSEKTGGNFSSCSCGSVKTLCQAKFFMVELRFFQEILLVFEFFQQATEESTCSLTQVFTW